jgi:hypothetical protein
VPSTMRRKRRLLWKNVSREREERSERDHTAFKPIGPTTDPKAIAYKIAEING